MTMSGIKGRRVALHVISGIFLRLVGRISYGTRLGIDFGAIEAVVLSHGHWDPLLARVLYGGPADMVVYLIAREEPPLGSVHSPPVAQDLQ
jgi:hypothetical protein